MKTMLKQKAYKDGIVSFFIPKEEFINKNIISESQLQYICHSSYRNENIRDQDQQFALNNDRKLSLKISIRYNSLIDSSKKALIGNDLFDIYDISPDKDYKEMYLYLERVRKIETRN